MDDVEPKPDEPPAERPAWSAERSVNLEEVAAWLKAAGRAPVGPVRTVAEGFDNFIFEADDLYVRATRRRIAREDIVKEIDLLPRVAALGGLAVPRPGDARRRGSADGNYRLG